MTEREQFDKMQSILLSGIELVEATLTHVSHGGPTREDAEKWVAQAKDVLTPEPPVATPTKVCPNCNGSKLGPRDPWGNQKPCSLCSPTQGVQP